MAKGGTRPGAGRPKGSLSQATKDKMKVEAALHKRILKAANRLFNAQVSIAEGCSYLYRVDEEATKHVLVTDPDEIRRYLDGQADTGSYYYITTEKPDNKAIDSMLDRVFGKAVSRIAGPDGGPIQVEGVEITVRK